MSDEADIVAAMKAKAEAKKKENAENPEMEGFTAAKPVDQEVQKQKDQTPSFMLKIYSPYKVYYEEDAHSVTADNETGPFDVLPGHKSFLTLLKACDVIIRNYRGDQTLKINRGVMHVKSDLVTIFLDV